MLLERLASTSRAVAAEPARNGKVALIADCLRELGPAEIPAAVALLAGEARRAGVGWAAVRELPEPAAAASLGVAEAEGLLVRLGEVHGAGSRAERSRLLAELFGRATEVEQEFLRAVLVGELRQGALDALMGDAVAKAAGVPAVAVRRALMLRGSARVVAEAALTGGVAALREFGLEVGRPVRPMLAASAPDVAAALEKAGEGRAVGVEWKLDGIRVQVHRDGGRVSVFTRSLDEITARVPEVVEAALSLDVRSAVLDGEAIALGPGGRPRPFQETAARTASRQDPAALRAETPLSVLFFDLLHRDGADLLDRPAAERWAALAELVPEELRVPRLVTATAEAAEGFFAAALAHGHEGVVVKELTAPYAAGRRGAGWIKVKPRHTLDLVVTAAEWGSGRRQGWLSNLHLAARNPEGTGEPGLEPWVMLGKTFKGLTDQLLTWQTEQLLARETHRDAYTVYVRPELVVEIAFDGLQRSPRYPAGLALRFARVLRYREDKRPEEADTVAAVRALAVAP
ncbi:ATP-dependent DNA ligase [Kitasatospora albolonga]|uniref:ATP-dependent DNA ligase n=1 Tax=Kitasatospora albolonga TaxID=68173 RepID=UPI0031F0C60B